MVERGERMVRNGKGEEMVGNDGKGKGEVGNDGGGGWGGMKWCRGDGW